MPWAMAIDTAIDLIDCITRSARLVVRDKVETSVSAKPQSITTCLSRRMATPTHSVACEVSDPIDMLLELQMACTSVPISVSMSTDLLSAGFRVQDTWNCLARNTPIPPRFCIKVFLRCLLRKKDGANFRFQCQAVLYLPTYPAHAKCE